MPQVGHEPTTTLFERAKTVDALYRPATVIGKHHNIELEKEETKRNLSSRSVCFKMLKLLLMNPYKIGLYLSTMLEDCLRWDISVHPS